MGLDMYLTRKVYVGLNYKHNNIGKNQLIINDKEIDITNLESLSFNVGYWRKFNALHNWMVENIQNGEDNCQSYYISKNQIRELISYCNADIKYLKSLKYDKKTDTYLKINEEKLNLKPVSGFFFGSTNIDMWHFEQLENTVKQLETVITLEGEFYYESSW